MKDNIEISKQLFLENNVQEFMEYLYSMFQENQITYKNFGHIYDKYKIDNDLVNAIINLDKVDDHSSVLRSAYNIINLSYLEPCESVTMGYENVIYSFFMDERGNWFRTSPKRDVKDNLFKESTFSEIISIVTEVSLNQDSYNVLAKKCNEYIYGSRYSELVALLGLINESFNPDVEPLSKNYPTYTRFKINEVRISPILKSIGITDIKNIDENSDLMKSIIDISPSIDTHRYHLCDFDYNGTRYQIFKNTESRDGWFINYRNIVKPYDSIDDVIEYLIKLKELKIGSSNFDSIFDSMVEDNVDFINSYIETVKIFSEKLISLRKNSTRIGMINDDELDKLIYFKHSPTELALTTEHHINLARANDIRYIRYAWADFNGFESYLDTDFNIYLKHNARNEIVKFENIDKFRNFLDTVLQKL